MERIEYKEGMITCGGSRASKEMKSTILVLSAISGKDISETCDLLNQFLQSFENILQNIAEALRELAEIFREVSQDICESCKSRRTRHGSSKAEKPRKAAVNIKWSEKYRPP